MNFLKVWRVPLVASALIWSTSFVRPCFLLSVSLLSYDLVCLDQYVVWSDFLPSDLSVFRTVLIFLHCTLKDRNQTHTTPPSTPLISKFSTILSLFCFSLFFSLTCSLSPKVAVTSSMNK